MIDLDAVAADLEAAKANLDAAATEFYEDTTFNIDRALAAVAELADATPPPAAEVLLRVERGRPVTTRPGDHPPIGA